MDKKAIIEVGKAFLRFIYFGTFGLIGTFLTAVISSGLITNLRVEMLGQSIDVTYIVLSLLTLIVKAIDLYVRYNKSISANGIAPEFLQR